MISNAKFMILNTNLELGSKRGSGGSGCGNHHISIEESSFSIGESLKNLEFLLNDLHFDIDEMTRW